MDEWILGKALALEKRMYVLLSEAMDLSRQLAQAIDRDDQVAIQMMLSMRREPLEGLRNARRGLEELRDSLPPEERERLAQLFNGAEAAGAEAPLAEQVTQNGRLLEQLVALDERLNRKICREKSAYPIKEPHASPVQG